MAVSVLQIYTVVFNLVTIGALAVSFWLIWRYRSLPGRQWVFLAWFLFAAFLAWTALGDLGMR